MQFTKEQLEDILYDIDQENDWRTARNLEAAYADGNQLTDEQIRLAQDRGMAPLVRNLITPTVNVVLGMEAKNRRDWKISSDDEASEELARALNPRLKKAERASGADVACSEAYAEQVKTGVSWVEVARESNPFRPAHRVRWVHRNEMFFDWRSTEWDFSDARYLVRRKWIDVPVLKVNFPKHKKLIEGLSNERSLWDTIGNWELGQDLKDAHVLEQFDTREEQEWRTTDRKRLCLYEVWYRIPVSGLVMKSPSGVVLEYNPENPRHRAAVAVDRVELQHAVFSKIRRSYWLGPNQLDDRPSPYPHNKFPYVPFWGFREDNTGVPYGMVKSMVSPQDEVNARLSKMMWMLSAKRMIADSDALDMPLEDAAAELARPDAVILLNPNRKNRDQYAFRIEQDFQLADKQFSVMQSAAEAIQSVSGVYQALLGNVDPSRSSGIAVNSLVEQGATTLAKLNSHYIRSRVMVGELLLALVMEDLGTMQQELDYEFDGERFTVVANERAFDDDGEVVINNSITHARMQVALEEVPDTPSFKAQQAQILSEVVKSLPPEVQVFFADFIVRLTDAPFKEEIVKRLQNVVKGMTNKEPSPAEQKAAELEQAMMELQAKAQSLSNEKMAAEIDKMRADIKKILADAEQSEAKVENIDADTDLKESQTRINEDDAALGAVERTQTLEREAQEPVGKERMQLEAKLKGKPK